MLVDCWAVRGWEIRHATRILVQILISRDDAAILVASVSKTLWLNAICCWALGRQGWIASMEIYAISEHVVNQMAVVVSYHRVAARTSPQMEFGKAAALPVIPIRAGRLANVAGMACVITGPKRHV